MLAISSLCACAVQNWPKTDQNDWRDVGRPSSCNAFAIAALSSYYFCCSYCYATGCFCVANSDFHLIRLLSSAKWQQDKRLAALDTRRQRQERTRQMKDVAQLLERLDCERQTYGQQAFNAWLRKRRLTAVPAVVDRLNVSAATCSRDHGVNTPRVRLTLLLV